MPQSLLTGQFYRIADIKGSLSLKLIRPWLEVCIAIQGNPATQVIKSLNHPIIRSAAAHREEVSQLNQQIRPSQHIRQTLLYRVLVERDIQRVS